MFQFFDGENNLDSLTFVEVQLIIGAVMFSFVNAMVELACPRNCISADLFASGHVV